MKPVRHRIPAALSAFSLSVAWLIGVAAVPSSAAATCTYDPNTRKAVIAFSGGDSVTVSRDSAGILLVGGNPCSSTGDPATVANTNTVEAAEAMPATAGNTNFTIDLAYGGFDRASGADVQFRVSLANQAGDTLTIASAGSTGSVIAGDLGPDGVTGEDTTGVNLNGDEAPADALDVDVRATGIQKLTMSAIATSVVLSAAGGGNAADGTATSRDNASLFTGPVNVPVTLNGNVGSDVLIGGNGKDVLKGQVPTGKGGDDELRGGAGDDTLTGGPGDDLLVGGPGNDVREAGGNGNDVWVQGNQWVYQSSDVPKNVPDGTSSVSSTIDVDAQDDVHDPAHSTMFDLNARVCLTSTDNSLPTNELTVSLTSPPQAATLNQDGTMVTSWYKAGGIKATLVRLRTQTNASSVFCYGTASSGTTFDSDAYTTIGSASTCTTSTCRRFDGRFHPEDSMEMYDGAKSIGYQFCKTLPCPANPSGVWTLKVVDSVASPGGKVWTLRGWSLQITYSTSNGDGSDTIAGGGGKADIVDYSGRSSDIRACLSNQISQCQVAGIQMGLTSGQSGEDDVLGNGSATVVPDVEIVYAGPKDDTLVGNDSNNELRGVNGKDKLYGLGGTDVLLGGGHDDYINGGDGDDSIYSSTGNDVMDGGANATSVGDVIKFGRSAAALQLDLCSTTDSNGCVGTATAGSDNYTIRNVEQIAGTKYPDTMTGGPGDDTLMGGAGGDTISGLGGTDRLDGGPQVDNLDCGDGSDFYRPSADGDSVTSCESTY